MWIMLSWIRVHGLEQKISHICPTLIQNQHGR
jgi:hypothetical protein